MITDSWHHLRYGARILRKRPRFTLVITAPLRLESEPLQRFLASSNRSDGRSAL